jgi:hypothetical protein
MPSNEAVAALAFARRSTSSLGKPSFLSWSAQDVSHRALKESIQGHVVDNSGDNVGDQFGGVRLYRL